MSSKGPLWDILASGGLAPLGEGPVTMPFLPGQILCGKYEVIKLLGAGGMGFVVAANHIELGEAVALKFLRPEALANPEIVGRFAREARASARIKSEYVVRVFDVGALPDGAPFIVMEYLEGKDLSDVVREQGPLPSKVAVEYLLQACEALASAHASGVVHRDIKPENLFLTQRAQGMDIIKVLDFGISKVALTGSAFESKLPMVRTMLPMGSPVYMSPEQIRAVKDIDARTDIWSLGCVLYELLSAKAAFDAPSLTQLSAIILEQSPMPLSALCADVPPELEAIVERCLEKDRNKRFQDIGELAVALYPFGPRRGRLSAERCCYVLKTAGLTQAEVDLPSIRPPSWNGLSTGSAPISLGAIPAQNPARTSNPASITVSELTQVRPAGSGKRAILLGAVVAAIAGAYALSAHRSSAPTAAAAGAPLGGAPLNAAPLTAPPPTAPTVLPAPNAAVIVPPQPTISASSVKTSTPSPQPRSRPSPPQAKAKATPSAPSVAQGGNHEPDVGF